MKKKSLRRISIFGLVLISFIVSFLVYFHQNKAVKAMPENAVQATDKNENSKVLEKSITPVVGSLGTKESIVITSEINLEYTNIWLNISEVISKTDEEIIADIETFLEMNVLGSGNVSGYVSRVSDVSTLTEENRGYIEIVAEVKVDERIYKPKIKVLVLPNGVFGKDDGTGWENLPLNATNGFLENPINGAKLGFPQRGVMTKPVPSTNEFATDTGFLIVDKYDKGYVYGGGSGIGSGRVSSIPYINGSTYSLEEGQAFRSVGVGWSHVANVHITNKIFLRKGNVLKEILFDTKNQISYVYDLKLEKNMNFSVSLSMYNLSPATKSFSMLENVDTDFYNDHVPIYSLGDNSGFYLKTLNKNYEEVRFAIKLKNNGAWLSDYTKYKVTTFGSLSDNQFGADFLINGHETQNISKDTVILQGKDSAYQLGAPPRAVTQDEALSGGYQIFVGNELPYMKLTASPVSFDVYDNREDRLLNINYDLTTIPSVGEKGNINVTYPEGQVEKIPFVADLATSFKGAHTLKLDNLPNEEIGTIKRYGIDLLAAVESESIWTGLPSNNVGIEVNVYNFGGTPVLKAVKKDSVWNKSADELITSPVALPGHKIAYEYASHQPDTSKTGMQWTEVLMTDQQDTKQTKIIKVPILVVDGPLPSGLWVNAEDIYLNKSEVTGMTSSQIEKYILEKSKAVGYDINTGLNKDIELSVTKTTLTGRPDISIPHSATIQASKTGLPSATKDIQIFLIEDPKISAALSVEKKDIKLGEVNTYTATFKDEAPIPTKLIDVQFKTIEFPEYTLPDKDSVDVQVNGININIPKDSVELTANRELKVTIPKVDAGAKVDIKYGVRTLRDTPPANYPTIVNQFYELTGKRADGNTFPQVSSDMDDFVIFPATATIQIKYLMEGSDEPIPNNYSSAMSGDIGNESELVEFLIEDYELSKVQFDRTEQPLPAEAFKVKYGAVETITFYYKGVLKIKSAPNTIDFGSKKVSARSEEYDDSTYDQPLVIWDNRLSLTEWKVTLKQSDDMKLSGEAEQRLAGALRYKMADEEKILSKDSQEVFRSAHQTSGEYDVSKTWGPNKQGLRLKVPVGMVKQTGTYETTLTWRIEETY